MRFFRIDGEQIVVEVPDGAVGEFVASVIEDKLLDALIDIVEELGCFCGGGIGLYEVDEDGQRLQGDEAHGVVQDTT